MVVGKKVMMVIGAMMAITPTADTAVNFRAVRRNIVDDTSAMIMRDMAAVVNDVMNTETDTMVDATMDMSKVTAVDETMTVSDAMNMGKHMIMADTNKATSAPRGTDTATIMGMEDGAMVELMDIDGAMMTRFPIENSNKAF